MRRRLGRFPCFLLIVIFANNLFFMTEDLSPLGLGIGMMLMVIPLYFLSLYKTKLVRSTMNGTIRMVVQLFLIGLYLRYLFYYDLWYVNLAWGLIMVGVATGTALQRTNMKLEVLLMPITVGFLSTALFVSIYFLALVLNVGRVADLGLTLDTLFSARYFIPIFGILLGNMLGVNVVALNTYYEGIRRERQMFYYLLGNGATLWEATAPFIRGAIRKAFNPCIANMAVMGLVALPGTMIGQILGGSDPGVAIKYQMMIVVITFVASMLSLMITIALAMRRSFDKYGRMLDVFRS